MIIDISAKQKNGQLAFTLIGVEIPNDPEEGMTYISHKDKNGIISQTHLIFIDSIFLLHKDDGPASIISCEGTDTEYRFALFGVHVSIEELNISDEEKVVLKLKYENHNTFESVYI